MEGLFAVIWLVATILIFVYGIKVCISKIKKNDYKKEKNKFKLSLIISIVSLIAIGITAPEIEKENKDLVSGDKDKIVQEIILSGDENIITQENVASGDINTNEEQIINNNEESQELVEKDFSKIRNEELAKILSYSKSPYYIVNNNVPFFYDSDLVTNSYEKYGNLDSLKRCTTVIACIGKDIMPTTERGNIGSVKPTGWHTVKYSGIDGNYLYNRCHLIGYQLTAENANEKNLITGTRYMNVEGMLPFENMVADYIKETNNHVLYRVTPIFEGNNLLASGVLMEAKSVEDNGEGILFNVYCYNVQPGIKIDYKTGESTGPEYTGETTNNNQTTNITPNTTVEKNNNKTESTVTYSYILNTSTKKVHLPTCSSVKEIKENNKDGYNGNVQNLTSLGYTPCGNCKPYKLETKKEETTTVTSTQVEKSNTNQSKPTYILNTNPKSMKFHYPSCGSVKKMDDSNKKEIFGSRDEAINLGYKPCGNCKP